MPLLPLALLEHIHSVVVIPTARVSEDYQFMVLSGQGDRLMFQLKRLASIPAQP